MKTIFKSGLLALLCYVPTSLLAQKDSLKLVCPLEEGVIVPPAINLVKLDPPDLSVMLTSIPDTVVKAVVNASVTNIERDDEGKFGVVLFARHENKDYYFWYTGLSKLTVRRLEQIKAGQPLGLMDPGSKIELLMFDFETPVDVARYLDCKGRTGLPVVMK